MDPLTPRDILARNVRKLIDNDRQSVRAWALARGLDVRLIDRITKASHAVTIDKIDEVAEACGYLRGNSCCQTLSLAHNLMRP